MSAKDELTCDWSIDWPSVLDVPPSADEIWVTGALVDAMAINQPRAVWSIAAEEGETVDLLIELVEVALATPEGRAIAERYRTTLVRDGETRTYGITRGST